MADTKEILYDTSYDDQLAITDEPTADEIDFDADTDRLPPPPIPDGVYFATVENAGAKVDGTIRPYRLSRWKNDMKDHYQLQLKATIIAPENPLIDGKTVYSTGPEHFRTAIKPDTKTSSVLVAGKALNGGQPLVGISELEHAKQLDKILQGKPTGYVYVRNELRDVDAEIAATKAGGKGPKAIRGQRQIMGLELGKKSDGTFSGRGIHPETKTLCASRAYLTEIKPHGYDPAKPFG